MTTPIKIVHLSGSALAGAPGMLARAQNQLYGYDAVHFRTGDHGHFRDLMSINTIPVKANSLDAELVRRHISEADVIHVHNLVSPFALSWLAEVDGINERTLIYQVHSPTRERPIYRDLSDAVGLEWDARLAVSQIHPRLFPTMTPVPNCLYRDWLTPRLRSRPRFDGPVRVVFSPSTPSRARWSSKSSPAFDAQLKQLGDNRRFELIKVTDVSPERLSATRSMADVSIDEVLTGGFHLVSYEGMAAGNVVVNGADELSLAAFAMGFRTNEPPPFLRTDLDGFAEQLGRLASDRRLLADWMDAAHDYYWRIMSAERVVGIYDEIYRAGKAGHGERADAVA
ncbi:hypothetical protein [Microlunatus sp. GCM10028923]|uniref:hypothetical protein n=1 Tax=Microlunatus sp. GCM10028923 TaxID=3273400 RepID=UPI003608B734